ncbi:MAG TPA: AbrB/MazE/SpoVT family DNA-binding domain-containing protein [Ideonella sp.]|nr:AbrB/MazE/SpoVT family DNA-binding domain-containing protein [Ideonella sp.]
MADEKHKTLATVTSKGRVTLPQSIRERLQIRPGARLDFKLNDDGTISVRLLKQSALSIVGLLHRPGEVAKTIEQMDGAVLDETAYLLRNARGSKRLMESVEQLRPSAGDAKLIAQCTDRD